MTLGFRGVGNPWAPTGGGALEGSIRGKETGNGFLNLEFCFVFFSGSYDTTNLIF